MNEVQKWYTKNVPGYIDSLLGSDEDDEWRLEHADDMFRETGTNVAHDLFGNVYELRWLRNESAEDVSMAVEAPQIDSEGLEPPGEGEDLGTGSGDVTEASRSLQDDRVSVCSCDALEEEENAILEANVDSKYLTSTEYVISRRIAEMKCPLHGSLHRFLAESNRSDGTW